MKTQDAIYDIMPLDKVAYVPHVYVWYVLILLALLALITLIILNIKRRIKTKTRKIILKELEKIKNSNYQKEKLETFLNNLIYLNFKNKIEEFKKIKKDFDHAKYAKKDLKTDDYLIRIEKLIKN